MKKLIILPILFFTFTGFTQSSAQALETAYKKKSNKLLDEFFQKWNVELPPIQKPEFSQLSDTLRQANEVYTAFYKPLNIDSLGGSEWGANLYGEVKYLIVQNDIKIYFSTDENFKDSDVINLIKEQIKVDSFRERLIKKENGKFCDDAMEIYNIFKNRHKSINLVDSIINFRPKINCGSKIPLYLNANYSLVLNAFLGSEHLPLGYGGIMNPAKSVGESKKRQKFLERYIKIWPGHWGGYWQLLSYPAASSITFDEDMQHATVEYRMVYEGGVATLKKENGNWVLVSAKRTWIE